MLMDSTTTTTNTPNTSTAGAGSTAGATAPVAADAIGPTDSTGSTGGGAIAGGACGSLLGGAGTLWRREMVRFFRQRNRVIGALGTPIVFWLVLGSGLDRLFRAAGEVAAAGTAGGTAGEPMGYLAYFFPGTLVLILLFTAIFSTISVIEDRREGFLQAVLVAPVPRGAIVLGKVLGGASIATIQGVLFLLVAPLIGVWPGVGAAIAAIGVMFVLAMGLTALGLCIAWPMDSTTGFHAIMNLFLMPMWLLSGALFPVATAPLWLAVIMYANPLTYGHAVLAGVLHGSAAPGATVPWLVALGVMLAASALGVLLASWIVTRPRQGGG